MRSLCFACVSIAALIAATFVYAQPSPVAAPDRTIYSQPVACPSDQRPIAMPSHVPAGWQAIGGSVWVVLYASIEDFQGQQFLRCQYSPTGKWGEANIIIRRSVPNGACAAGPGAKAFLCKPGAF